MRPVPSPVEGSRGDSSRRVPADLVEDHQIEPDDGDVQIGLNDPSRLEELRLTPFARVVVDRHFAESGPGPLGMFDELDADRPAVAARIDTQARASISLASEYVSRIARGIGPPHARPR